MVMPERLRKFYGFPRKNAVIAYQTSVTERNASRSFESPAIKLTAKKVGGLGGRAMA